MENKENILDSGEIYKDPENETRLYLPELELKPTLYDSVDWKPLDEQGTTIKIHKLVVLDENKIKFVGTYSARLFSLTLFVLGIVGAWKSYLVYLFVSLFGILTYLETGPSVFNKRVGLFWKSWHLLSYWLYKNKKVGSVKLEDIKAIQFIEKHITSNDSSFYSYEINLILTNYERINVTDHGDKESALKDATYLAEFLDIPFLNGLGSRFK